MSYERKKEWERRYFNRAKSLYGGLPSGMVIASEEPDFLVWNGEKNCGIEIVQYVRGQGKNGSRLRWREELHNQIVGSAKLKHEARSAIALSVHVHWFHHMFYKMDIFFLYRHQVFSDLNLSLLVILRLII